MSAPIFPDAPVLRLCVLCGERLGGGTEKWVDALGVKGPTGREYEIHDICAEMLVADLVDDDYDGDPDARSCWTCGGEGFKECDGDCKESDDCGCPYARGHLTTCPNCRGSGDAKDVWYW